MGGGEGGGTGGLGFGLGGGGDGLDGGGDLGGGGDGLGGGGDLGGGGVGPMRSENDCINFTAALDLVNFTTSRVVKLT